MTVKFNGVVEKRTKGCSSCGHKKYESVFMTKKSYFLPSGIEKTFYVGAPVELSEADANFLLSYRYIGSDGDEHSVFEVV